MTQRNANTRASGLTSTVSGTLRTSERIGINQTVMLALSMLVITALVGTRDLGQEVYIALTKADVGRGLVAGLCVAAIAIIADRLIQTAARGLAARQGGRTREP